jgi:hypothetical protein
LNETSSKRVYVPFLSPSVSTFTPLMNLLGMPAEISYLRCDIDEQINK